MKNLLILFIAILGMTMTSCNKQRSVIARGNDGTVVTVKLDNNLSLKTGDTIDVIYYGYTWRVCNTCTPDDGARTLVIQGDK